MKKNVLVLAAVFFLVGVAVAQPAPWYKWKSNLDGKVFCLQTSPGPGWTRVGGPYIDSHCRIPANRSSAPEGARLTQEEMLKLEAVVEGTSPPQSVSPQGMANTMSGGLEPLNWAFDIQTAVSGGGHSACQDPIERQPHIDCGRGCSHPQDTFISWSPDSHPHCNRAVEEKQYCNPKDAWTGWVTVGSGVGNPCPNNCKRGDEIGLAGPRSVGLLPPRIQFKHKFECLLP